MAEGLALGLWGQQRGQSRPQSYGLAEGDKLVGVKCPEEMGAMVNMP